MAESPLSFVSSENFRNTLLGRNLPPYSVVGNYTPPSGPITYETVLSNYSVIDSPNDLNQTFPNKYYGLNEFGPDGGYNLQINYNGPPLPVTPNQGPYPVVESQLLLVSDFYLNNSYIINEYSPNGGYNYVYNTELIQNPEIKHIPYLESFVPSAYSPFSILSSTNPTGSDGTLSQDSYLAKIGAKSLNDLFLDRINFEIYQSTVGAVNLNSLTDPFEASLLITGQQPLIYRNWRITVPENPLIAAVDFASRITGSYWPVSFIPGDYFDENEYNGNTTTQTSSALSTINQLTGGLLGPILNIKRNPSQIFLANTGNGQRSALFANIYYNKYQPGYSESFGGALGIGQGLVNLVNNLVNPNGTVNGGYYVGNKNAEPSQITSPSNEIPVNSFGKQVPTIVYGPSELGQLYEGNIDTINFGLQGKSYSDGGGIDGQMVWTSPKRKGGAGYKATQGGGLGSLDNEFNLISSNYTRDESTNIEFKTDSILDNTQKLINSADNVQGINRLKHVGNAINQVSKVFNDGYKEMTKGSQVVSYNDMTTGGEAGIEYCRVFTKDTPYFTYADLQKTDGITTSGRRFSYSVFDNTYNLNIAPLKNPGSTNIVQNDKGKYYAKKYMFSLENLAWRTSSRPGFTYDDLPICEKGPNGGRVMWFPPYDIKFNDTSNATWTPTNFLGRPEPIYTYRDSSRSGTLSWKIVVDSPSVLNTIVEKQLKGVDNERVNSILDSFFAGCVKFDIYELAKKFNQVPISDLMEIQEILNNPRLTAEELNDLKNEIPKDNTNVDGNNANNSNNSNTTTNNDTTVQDFENKYLDFAFYFENDIPGPHTVQATTTTENFETIYTTYIGRKSFYQQQANSIFNSDSVQKNTTEFFDNIIISNYNTIAGNPDNCFIKDAINILEKKLGTIEIVMQGSASAIATKDYNVSLSKRRLDTVTRFLKTKSIGGKTLEPYFNDGTFKITLAQGFGENIVIPRYGFEFGATVNNITTTTQTVNSGVARDVNCNEDIRDKNNKITDNSQIYATSAMACRRVKIKEINVITKPSTPIEPTPPLDVPTTEKGKNIKPKPTKTITQKLKEGLSKKVLRSLLSECDYFEMIKEEIPMVYDSIREKIKYFNPAFHSMTPEGLNSRLTFLNQCVRPGETIPVIDPNGKPKYNDALNTSFGAPPVLVLRIGDFFNVKILPESVGFSYEPLVFDINPEGIGIQPMIANVTMNFKIIGGMGLKEPVNQLQNALSFNYYANTEIYDERAVWTDDSFKKLDKEVYDAILLQQPVSTVVNNVQQQNNGGDTIGEITITTPVTSGETGTILYSKTMDKLVDVSQTYFTNIVNQMENVALQYNFGVLSRFNKVRNYKVGTLLTPTSFNAVIYGKPAIEGVQNSEIDDLFNDVETNISAKIDPIMNYLKNKSLSDLTLNMISDNMIKFLKKIKPEFSNGLYKIIQDIVTQELDLIFLIRQINLIVEKVDGKILEGLTPKVYNISGTTVGNVNTYDELTNDYKTFGETINNYSILLDDVTSSKYSPNTYYLDNQIDIDSFSIFARIFTDKNKLEEFKNFVITTEVISNGTEKARKFFNNICDDLTKQYQKELDKESKFYSDFKKSPEYKKYTTDIQTTMYRKGKVRDFVFSTVVDDNNSANQEKIQKLYANVNCNDDINTFDCKYKI